MRVTWCGKGRTLTVAMALTGVTVLAAACSSSSTTSSASTAATVGPLPSTITVLNIEDLSTPLAFAGTPASNGIALAVKQINSEHFLGNTKLVVVLKDAQGNPQQAASWASTAVANSTYSAILGPLYSAEAQAVAPIAEKAGIPMIATQAGSTGVLLGNYTWRVTASIGNTYGKTLAYLQSKGVKKLDVIYTSDIPTLVDAVQTALPSLVSHYGITLGQIVGIPSDAEDLTSPVAKLVADKPDAVSVLLDGTQNGTAVGQLRQQGFTGPIVAATAAGTGNLKPAGTAGIGVVWTTDFSAADTAPAAAAFTKAYKAAYGATPTNYAAEAFDSAWFLARGIKASGSATRAGIAKGLDEVGATGFDGAEGHLTFVDHDLRVPGVLVEWNGTEETLVP